MKKRYSESCKAQQAGVEVGLSMACAMLEERAKKLFIAWDDDGARAVRQCLHDMKVRRGTEEAIRDRMWKGEDMSLPRPEIYAGQHPSAPKGE